MPLEPSQIDYFEQFHTLYKDDPVGWVRDILLVDKIEPYQEDALRGLAEKHYVSMATGTGVGKTAILAWAGLWFLTTHPGCNIIATAPTAGQLKSCLWKEFSIWINKSYDNLLSVMLDYNQNKIWVSGSKDDWFILARTASHDAKAEASESMSGIHSDSGVLFLCDEASGIDETVFAALEGSFTAQESYAIYASNPVRVTGSFFRSHHQEKELWHTMQISSEDSARVDKAYIERMKARFGEQSPVYRSKVQGKFPRNQGEEMVLFNEYIERLKLNESDDGIHPSEIVAGLDVARYGNDNSVLVIRNGYEVIEVVSSPSLDTIDTTSWAWMKMRQYAEDYPDYQVVINIDAIGLGAGVADGLVHKVKEANRSMKFRTEPIVAYPIEYSKRAEDAMFANVRAESFFNARTNMDKCIWSKNVDNTFILRDLEDIGYSYDKTGKIIIESKDDIKKRNHGTSPDYGDAFILCMNDYHGKGYETVRKTIKERKSVATRSNRLKKSSVFNSGGQRLSNMRWS